MLSFAYLLLGLLIISSFIILYQDFSKRLVSLWVLILFGAISITSVLYFRDFQTLIYNFFTTCLYLGFIWLMLKLYLYLKFGKNKPLLNELLGAADVLIILFVGVSFNVIGLIFFFCFAFICSLLAFFVYSLLKKNDNEETIPLAGFLVFFYISAIITLNLIENPFLIDCSFVN